MSIRVGTDIMEIDRFRKVLARRPGLKQKLFSDGELAYCESKADPTPHLAARFCAKEAVSKALGTGVRGFSMSEVEVVRDGFGRPSIELHGRALKLADTVAARSLEVSISHSKLFALAVVVIEI